MSDFPRIRMFNVLLLVSAMSVSTVMAAQSAPSKAPPRAQDTNNASPAERSARFEPQRGRGRGGRGRRGRRSRNSPQAIQRLKYLEAGERLDELDDRLRMLHLLTVDDAPDLVARRREIANRVLRDIRKLTERFIEALWLEGIDIEEDLLASVEPRAPMSTAIGLATIRGSLSQLRTMWRSWRRDRDIVHVERYEEVQNEVVELLVTYDALIYTASE